MVIWIISKGLIAQQITTLRILHSSLLSLLLLTACGTSRSPAVTDRETPAIKDIALDPLGQLYTVSGQNEITQYLADGSEGFRYNNNTLGELAVVDPSNPFSILLYYPNFQTIVLLDRTLNERGRIVLSKLGLLNIELAALANDNFIWVYDAAAFQLKKLDEQGNIDFTSDRLNLLLGRTPRPNRLIARHNRLLLNDPETGILLFDQFGRLESTLPVAQAENLQMINEQTLIYLKSGSWYRYDLRALQESPLDLTMPCAAGCTLLIGKEKMYWLAAGAVQQRSLR